MTEPIMICESEVGAIPSGNRRTVSFVHEYVHYLQSVSSLAGFRLLVATLAYAVEARALATGDIEDTPHNRKMLAEKCKDLEAQCTLHWRVAPRARSYFGRAGRKLGVVQLDLNQPEIYDRVWGVTVRGSQFRPITVAVLAEGMARRIDRIYARNEEITDVPGSDSRIEREQYNLIYAILKHWRYVRNVPTDCHEAATIVICGLALLAGRPDRATAELLKRIRSGRLPSDIVAWAITLREHLQSERWIGPNAYADVVRDFEADVQPYLDLEERQAIGAYVNRIIRAVSAVWNNPTYFASEAIGWPQVRHWMIRFSLPRVTCGAEVIAQIDGVNAENILSDLLTEFWSSHPTDADAHLRATRPNAE